MCAIGNTKGDLKQHKKQNIGISNNLSHLIPLPTIALHTSLITSNTVHCVDTLLFGKEACTVGCVGEEDEEDDGPDKSDKTKDDKEPLHTVSYESVIDLGDLPSKQRKALQSAQYRTPTNPPS